LTLGAAAAQAAGRAAGDAVRPEQGRPRRLSGRRRRPAGPGAHRFVDEQHRHDVGGAVVWPRSAGSSASTSGSGISDPVPLAAVPTLE